MLKRNGKEYQKLSDHVGKYPVVMISPADSALITEGSEERRKFLNKIVSQYNTEYLDSVLKYSKALQQRNKLLKDFKHHPGGLILICSLSGIHSLLSTERYVFSERNLLVK